MKVNSRDDRVIHCLKSWSLFKYSLSITFSLRNAPIASSLACVKIRLCPLTDKDVLKRVDRFTTLGRAAGKAGTDEMGDIARYSRFDTVRRHPEDP